MPTLSPELPTGTAAAPDAASVDALADRIAVISAQTTVLEHDRLTCLRRFDEIGGWGRQGARSCPHWLSWKTGMDAARRGFVALSLMGLAFFPFALMAVLLPCGGGLLQKL